MKPFAWYLGTSWVALVLAASGAGCAVNATADEGSQAEELNVATPSPEDNGAGWSTSAAPARRYNGDCGPLLGGPMPTAPTRLDPGTPRADGEGNEQPTPVPWHNGEPGSDQSQPTPVPWVEMPADIVR